MKKSAFVALSFALCLSSIVLLAACSGDSDTAKVTETADDDADIVADSFDELNACGDKLDGQTAYVKEEKLTYVCDDGHWVVDSTRNDVHDSAEQDRKDSADTTEQDQSKSADTADIVVDSFDDLNVCGNKLDGKIAYVKDEKHTYICEDGNWEDISDSGKDSDNVEHGQKKPADDSVSTSAKTSSCAEVSVSACNTWDGDYCMYSDLIDERDDKTYKMVKIGCLWWMTRNLNYNMDDSYCYSNSEMSCMNHGRLYKWNAALEACPSGSHLPSQEEWEVLMAATGDQKGSALKSRDAYYPYGLMPPVDLTNTYWRIDISENTVSLYDQSNIFNRYVSDNAIGGGTDYFSFNAIPSGRMFTNSENKNIYEYAGERAYFWSSTKSGNDRAYSFELQGGKYDKNTGGSRGDVMILNSSKIEVGYSVRCILDEEPSEIFGRSSSSAISSSSASLATECKTKNEDTCEYDTLTDERDGQTYRTVKIGDQWWMAENLNFAYLQPTSEWDSSSFCFNDSLEYCEKFGRLYLWSAAIDSAGIYGDKGKGCGDGIDKCLPSGVIQGVCPNGWHLPDTTEKSVLLAKVGGKNSAGKVLKSTSGWCENDRCSGTDNYGFTALRTGYKDADLQFIFSNETYFWNATENTSSDAFAFAFDNRNDAHLFGGFYKGFALSIRCVKD